MARQVLISSDQIKIISEFTVREKAKLVEALDLMESIGRIGEPLFRELNVWKYRVDNLRLIYRVLNDKIQIVRVVKGIAPSWN